MFNKKPATRKLRLHAPNPRRTLLPQLRPKANPFCTYKKPLSSNEDSITAEVKRIIRLPPLKHTSKACSAKTHPTRLKHNPIEKDSFFRDLELLSEASTCDESTLCTKL